MDPHELRSFASSSDTIYACVQVLPLGEDACVIGFMLFDEESTTRLSLIFRVEGFDSDRAQLLMMQDIWLISLAAMDNGTILALDVSASVHTLAVDQRWTVEKISDKSLWRLCNIADGTVLALGDGGTVLQFDGTSWNARDGAPDVQLLDADGGGARPVYICGDRGFLGRLERSRVISIDLYRDDMLRGIDVSEDGTIRIAGGTDNEAGVTLRLQNEEVRELKNSGHVHFSVRSFQGLAFWGDEVDVYEEAGQNTEALDATDMGADLRCNKRFLYCTGDDLAHRYDGNQWKTLELVFDEGRFRLE